MVSSDLRNRIFFEVQNLKKGEVLSYKELAIRVGSHPRAVAKILSLNKDISVPCYKIIRSDRKIGGYNFLLKKSKEELLKSEGVKINNGLVV